MRKHLVGRKFGRLIVLEFSRSVVMDFKCGRRTYPLWKCLCDCGNTVEVKSENLNNGHTRSCGCMKDLLGQRSVKHGMTETVEFKIWTGILTRCLNPNSRAFDRYGGNGVTVCDRWREDFSAFLADMGLRPSTQHSIDRIDNSGNYEPSNCRWATRKEQANNKTANVVLTFNGKTMTAAQWSECSGISRQAIYQRIKAGWTHARTLTTPQRRVSR